MAEAVQKGRSTKGSQKSLPKEVKRETRPQEEDEETLYEMPKRKFLALQEYNQTAYDQEFAENVDRLAENKDLRLKVEALTGLVNEKKRELSVFKAKRGKLGDYDQVLQKTREHCEDFKKKKSLLADEVYEKNFKNSYEDWWKKISQD